jgi:hypothetical protein
MFLLFCLTFAPKLSIRYGGPHVQRHHDKFPDHGRVQQVLEEACQEEQDHPLRVHRRGAAGFSPVPGRAGDSHAGPAQVSAPAQDHSGHHQRRKRRQEAVPRQHKTIPAIISGENGGRKQFHASKITNLSLGGINLVVPKNEHNGCLDDDCLENFDVVFALPQEERPITIQCQGKRVFQTQDSYQVGASFDDADLDSYQALQSYLY